MDTSLAPRVLATLCLDASLALLTGLLLAIRWLQPVSSEQSQLRQRMLAVGLPCVAACLLLACGAHLYLLTADFTGETSMRGCLQQMPSMLSTHAGKVDLAALAAALGLFLVTLLPSERGKRFHGTPLLLCVVLLFRAVSGHAAVGGFAGALQFLHLVCMAVWSGGVLVSGLYVVPRIVSANEALSSAFTAQPSLLSSRSVLSLRTYMKHLSRASTWAVTLVFLTGVVKSYRALGGDVHLIRSALWGNILLAKILTVSFALSLGALNRISLTRTKAWNPAHVRRAVLTLRLEAWVMLAILALSAALGNISPPQTS